MSLYFLVFLLARALMCSLLFFSTCRALSCSAFCSSYSPGSHMLLSYALSYLLYLDMVWILRLSYHDNFTE